MFRSRLKIILAALLVAFTAGTVSASTTAYCPDATSTGRIFSVTTDPASSCLGYGSGALGGDDTALATISSLTGAPSGLVLIDKSDNTTSGVMNGAIVAVGGSSTTSGFSGTFSIVAPGYSNFVAVFQSGTGQPNPDWGAFILGPGVTTVQWAISGSQGLSHISLYGVPAAVPLPATGLLLLGGLGGLAALKRRRKTT